MQRVCTATRIKKRDAWTDFLVGENLEVDTNLTTVPVDANIKLIIPRENKMTHIIHFSFVAVKDRGQENR